MKHFLNPKKQINKTLDVLVIENYSKLNASLYFLPVMLIISLVSYLFVNHALTANAYVKIQEKYFYLINAELSQYPELIYNFTQLGDSLIFFSFLSIFIIYAPKLWENLLSATCISLVISNVLKYSFQIPRPARILEEHSFTIIGKTLNGYNSLPSGHSITVFTFLTVLFFAFMPSKYILKSLWFLVLFCLGLFVAFTRVGVGAHFPLDVIFGSIFGIISGISGILINKKNPIWYWIYNKKYYPIFILLFLLCSVILIYKIYQEYLVIFYLALLSLLVTLFSFAHVYIKK